jgi:DNA-binding Lrp family transcriptional regulator
MEAGAFATIQELAEAVGLSERHVSRQLRLAYLAPAVLKRLTCGREPSAVSLYDLCFLAEEAWREQEQRVFD